MKITDIRFVRLTGVLTEDIAVGESQALMPADVDPAFAARPFEPPGASRADADGVRRVRQTFVHVDTDEGLTAVGPMLGLAPAEAIHRQVRPWLIGRDAVDVEDNVDLVRRLLGGRRSQAMSVMQSALYDLHARAEGVPVYQLLGGPKRESIPAYAGTVGATRDPRRAADLAPRLKAAGFRGQKWYPPCGPGHGCDALERNVAFARLLRDAIGDEMDLMLDVHRGWTVDFALRMVEALAPLRPRWIEEPVMPDDAAGYARIGATTDIPLAGGEDVSTLSHMAYFAENSRAAVLQPDEDGIGGIDGMLAAADIARREGVQMIPHCGYQTTLHVLAALPPEVAPLYEYLVLWNPYGQWFLKHKDVPADGAIPLPDRPGLGIDFDESRIEQRQELTF